jgi:hypothetical protein
MKFLQNNNTLTAVGIFAISFWCFLHGMYLAGFLLLLFAVYLGRRG